MVMEPCSRDTSDCDPVRDYPDKTVHTLDSDEDFMGAGQSAYRSLCPAIMTLYRLAEKLFMSRLAVACCRASGEDPEHHEKYSSGDVHGPITEAKLSSDGACLVRLSD
jgi:hypothetical protein